MGHEIIRPGRYRHFKGNEYEVLGLARHSENDDLLVVYRPLYKMENEPSYRFWVRPLAMFNETVKQEGAIIPRFTYVGEM